VHYWATRRPGERVPAVCKVDFVRWLWEGRMSYREHWSFNLDRWVRVDNVMRRASAEEWAWLVTRLSFTLEGKPTPDEPAWWEDPPHFEPTKPESGESPDRPTTASTSSYAIQSTPPDRAGRPDPTHRSRATEADHAIVEQAGRAALADELYNLRCELALAELRERYYTAAQQDEMRERVAVLEPIVGKELNESLASEHGH
jgi:hypothetical protein